MDITGPRITPSKPDYWQGTAGEGNFTREQVLAARQHGETWRRRRLAWGLPATFDVNLTPPPSYKDPQPEGHIATCPVVSASRDRTRLCVLAPNGMEAWVPWK